MRWCSDYAISQCCGFPQMEPVSSTWYSWSFYSFERMSSLLRENKHFFTKLRPCLQPCNMLHRLLTFRNVITITYLIPNNFLTQSLCSFDHLLPINRGLLLLGSLPDSIAANLNAQSLTRYSPPILDLVQSWICLTIILIFAIYFLQDQVCLSF